jgi:mitochondrial fission protein ELM1
MMTLPTCWVITDGKAGMESQCVGLAEALGLEAVIKRTRLRSPWRQLSPTLLRSAPRRALSVRADSLAPPWPDLLIASGRQSVLPSLMVGEESPRTIRVQIQNPTIDPNRFDLIVVPRHDRLRGPNVIVSRGALHRVNATRLEEARRHFASRLDPLPRPRIAVLVGGDNGVYRLTPEIVTRLAEQLMGLTRAGASLMVTPSRRTGAANETLLREKLRGAVGEVWDGQGGNPYFGYLAHADAIVVTEDSVNMVSEAAATGKPVYLVTLQGGSSKFRRFRSSLEAEGVARPFEGAIESWSYPPFDDMAIVAKAVAERMTVRGIHPSNQSAR